MKKPVSSRRWAGGSIRRWNTAALAFCLLPSAFCFPAFADVVYFQSGDSLKGLVVEEHFDRIVVSTEEGEKTILRDEIDEVFYTEPERNYLYLGRQAMAYGGFDLARGFFRKALKLDPRFTEADDALHHLEDRMNVGLSTRLFSDPLGKLKKYWGLTLRASGRLPLIQEVEKGSLAERSGLHSGDGLVSAWGLSLAHLPLDQVAQELLGAPKSRVKLTLERKVAFPPALPFEHNWPAVKLTMERLGLTTGRVEKNGVAQLSGLVPGDRIVNLNGQPTRYLALNKAQELLRRSGDQGANLWIHRDLMIIRD